MIKRRRRWKVEKWKSHDMCVEEKKQEGKKEKKKNKDDFRRWNRGLRKYSVREK